MIPRYQTEIMQTIWSEENKYAIWYDVEVAYLEAYLAYHQDIDQDSLLIDRLKNKTIDWVKFSQDVQKYEKETHHDVIAFLQSLEAQIGKDARLIHIGLTSSDIVDTAFALILKQAAKEINKELKNLLEILWRQANLYRKVICIGRTHGQPAEPTTFGIKLLSHLCELIRGSKRLELAIKDISVGKLSGAVGVYAYTRPEIELQALTTLGLTPETVATQVVARDRHAAFFVSLATLAGSIERLAVEIRLLMHGEIQEAFEPFFKKQQGSSAMPHKKNPILSENLTGLMRLIRSYSMAAMENQALWHERDISHSCVERVIAPDATSIMVFALKRLANIFSDLVIDKNRMTRNFKNAGDILCSQGVMLHMIKLGVMRQEAYKIVQMAALKNNGKTFKEELIDAGIKRYLDEPSLDKILLANKKVIFEDSLFQRVAELMCNN
jgi:adenylosuccinate lyase